MSLIFLTLNNKYGNINIGDIVKTRGIKVMFRTIQILIVFIAFAAFQNTTNSNNVKIKNDNYNKNLDLTAMARLVDENLLTANYIVKGKNFGELTGYIANCPLCSGKLSCMPNLDVNNGNTQYLDQTYGSIMIVAAAQDLACGSIIRFSNQKISSSPVLAIVLDRGVGSGDIDLLVDNVEKAYQIGRTQINYDIIRNGWEEVR